MLFASFIKSKQLKVSVHVSQIVGKSRDFKMIKVSNWIFSIFY